MFLKVATILVLLAILVLTKRRMKVTCFIMKQEKNLLKSQSKLKLPAITGQKSDLRDLNFAEFF